MMLIAQAAQNPPLFWIAAFVLSLTAIFFCVGVWFWVGISRLWLRSFTSAAGVNIVDLLGMKFRKTNAKLIIDCRIMSVQAETPISMKQLEQAHLSGADVELATRAFIESEKTGQGRSFEELVDASRSEKLAAMLGYKN